MHLVASAIMSFLLSPCNWVIALIIAGYFFKKSSVRKSCRIAALCLFLVFSNQWLLDCYAKYWQPPPVAINKNVTYSCGIVPGGFASPDVDGNGYFNGSADRFIEAEKLYKLGTIRNILINGGNGKEMDKNFREGAYVKDQLVIMGIPDSVIFVEDESDNTADNARNAKRMLDSLQLKPPYLLITSAQHIPRASLLYKSAGMSVVEFPCTYIAGRNTFTLSSLLPTVSVLLTWDIYLKETAAYLFYKLKR
jgi:uncharacterized SAM-binding protein YcdF (DUF218 family)